MCRMPKYRKPPGLVASPSARAPTAGSVLTLLVILKRSLYGNLSWQYLFSRQYAEAEQAAQKALDLDDSQHWVETNLGHSFLLRGDLKKAKQVYREYMDQDGPKAKSMLLQDLDALEAGGVRHGDIGKARKWLQEQ